MKLRRLKHQHLRNLRRSNFKHRWSLRARARLALFSWMDKLMDQRTSEVMSGSYLAFSHSEPWMDKPLVLTVPQ